MSEAMNKYLSIHGDEVSYVEDEWLARARQLPALEQILRCEPKFASDAFDCGLRWLGQTDANPQETIERYSIPLGGQQPPLIDTWTGRLVDLFPQDHEKSGGSLPGWIGQITSSHPSPPMRAVWLNEGRSPFRELELVRNRMEPAATAHRRVLDFNLPTSSPKSRDDLHQTLVKLREGAEQIGHQLWLRGQNREYLVERPTNVRAWLGGFDTDISLLPSLARQAMSDDRWKTPWAHFGSPDAEWRRALFIWYARNQEWTTDDLRRRVDACAADRATLERFLHDVIFDPDVPAELDDFRQWWMGSDRGRHMPLFFQHFGMPTSTLDVSTDIEVATFFALNRVEDGMHVPLAVGERDGACIYVFATPIGEAWGQYIFPSDEPFADRDVRTFPRVPRIEAQKCGLLRGSNTYAYNQAAELLCFRIDLSDFTAHPVVTDRDLFPGPDVDDLYATMLNIQPDLDHLLRVRWR